ncbi:uncharacterized protein PRCAT00000506001 [Priceomyces carsonii]|uniref:uncharacterized protein n=1 Tax=Priceomyces carsonii TaxID=28549 RepID=UPI002ED7C72B|nr:unnamed protein product [Priceomyces carsonii]
MKRRKVSNETSPKRENISELESDPSDWEDVPLISTAADLNSFDISINSEADLNVEAAKRVRHEEILLGKQRRLTMHYLGMIAYLGHCSIRNKWLNDIKTLKRLKKMIPDALQQHVKKFNKNLKAYRGNATVDKIELDKHLIYIVKYAIKWFRFNYKLNSNGIRVLGYLPSSNMRWQEYFPENIDPIEDYQSFLSVLKDFKHNRDTGAQFFTALLAALGFECRLVFSLPLLPLRNGKLQPKLDHDKLLRVKDNDLLYPYFWTEVVNPIDSSELLILDAVCFHKEDDRLLRLKRFGAPKNQSELHRFYTSLYFPKVNNLNQITMHHVVAFEKNNSVIDVSSRYMMDISYRKFGKLDLRTIAGRCELLFESLLHMLNRRHDISKSVKEQNCLTEVALLNCEIPMSLSSLKRSPNFVAISSLRFNEVIPLNQKSIGSVKLYLRTEPIFLKNCVIVGKSEEQWKFLGRSVKLNEKDRPIKITRVSNPKSLYRKRRFNQHILSGNSDLNCVKLYAFHQTCPFIRESITYNRLPKNQFGNIEIFRNCMIPDGSSWVVLPEIEILLRSFKSKNISIPIEADLDYIPVVVGFNFSANGSITPVKKGVLVLKLDEILAKKIWFYCTIAMRKIKIQERKKMALYSWSSLLRRIRIKHRLDESYGFS